MEKMRRHVEYKWDYLIKTGRYLCYLGEEASLQMGEADLE